MTSKGIPFTQYLLPDGRTRQETIDRPADIEEMARKVMAVGGRFEAEILRTGHVSFEVVKDNGGETETVAIKICDNGPNVLAAVDKLVTDAHRILCIPATEAQ